MRHRTKEDIILKEYKTNKGNVTYSVLRKVSLLGIFHRIWWWAPYDFQIDDKTNYETTVRRWAVEACNELLWENQKPEVKISSRTIKYDEQG